MVRYVINILGLILLTPSVLDGQDAGNMAEFNPDFKFIEGIFFNFDQVRNNHPIPKARILTAVDFNDDKFFKEVLEKEIIYYYDEYVMRKEVKKDNIWGYSRNGVLYIQLKDDFHRITIVGGICHFVAFVKTYETRYYDPYFYRSYYYDYLHYPSRRMTYSKTELRQYMLDFESGKVMEYNYENVGLALMRDAELHDEYMKLSRRKRKQLKFLYIRKFNERNPFYLPAK
ncbi:MAG: hypothetical protein IIB05_00590 [Bacteroidetes bacterium]|nr:hypothetical protein [Bacteroidota bacterium]